MRPLFCRQALIFLRKSVLKPHFLLPFVYRNLTTISSHHCSSPSPRLQNCRQSFNARVSSPRRLHSLQEIDRLEADDDGDNEYDGPMNEFLSRFVHVIRGKLCEAYPDCNKETINGMLLVIVERVVAEMEKGSVEGMLQSTSDDVSLDFSLDLWNTVWEVCNTVLEEIKKERKREQMKKFIQFPEVKEMCHFASEVGIRGGLLRELRFKWAREKMEETDFYKELERMRKENLEVENSASKDAEGDAGVEDGSISGEEKPKVVLPQRRGKFKYKIYGLDLSSAAWAEVADKIHQSENLITPEEPKSITGKCKLVTERILGLGEEDDPLLLMTEWKELLQPSRVDWLALLDRLKQRNIWLYFKVAEIILNEESFGATIRDYSKLIDSYAKENRISDAERIIQKMTEKGIEPDIVTLIIFVHMYGAVGDLDRSKEAFEKLMSQGFQPDMKVYTSMIMSYVKAGKPRSAESLMREMEARDIKPSKEIYMELLRAYAHNGQVDGAQRIVNTMQFAGFQPSLESCTLLVEAYGQAGDPDQARVNFDYMLKAGHKLDDRCTASMIAAYEKKNLLDKALDLLLELEKDGFKPGIATYTVLVDWLAKLRLVDEAEQLLNTALGNEEAPLKIQVSLCDMYARSHEEEKARRALASVERQKQLLRADEFERIIIGLLEGGLRHDATRVHDWMQVQGFTCPESIKTALRAGQIISRQRHATR